MGRTSLSYDRLWERAEALLPVLRERAAKAEELRRMPDETVRDLHDSQLLRMHQPQRFGGAELDFGAIVTFGALLARACPSCAWNFANFVSHHHMLGMFAGEAQDEIWGKTPDALIAASFVFPAGKARKVEGGYILYGNWPFCSGIDPSEWTMLGGFVVPEGNGAPEQRVFLLHKAQYEIVDTWFVGGLRGTGSKDVKASEQFVPEHLSLAVKDIRNGKAPGSAVNRGALYQLPVFALVPYMLSGVALGIAEGMIDDFVGKNRVAKMTGARTHEIQSTQMRFSEAVAYAGASRRAQEANCREAQAFGAAGAMPDDRTKARYRLDGAYAVDWAIRAVDLIFGLSGASALYETGHAARAFRDAHAIRQHFTFNTDVASTTHGRIALGLPSDNATF